MKRKDQPLSPNVKRVLDAVAALLKRHGWYVFVIGGIGVHRDPLAPKYVYEFHVRFTGKPPEKTAHAHEPADHTN